MAPHFPTIWRCANGQWASVGNYNTSLPASGARGFKFLADGTATVLGSMGLLRWDGTQWRILGAGLNGDVAGVQQLADGSLLAAGLFTQSGTQSVPRLARWDGAAWTPYAGGLDGGVYDMIVEPDGAFLLGGDFGYAGGQPAHRVARLNGTQWTDLQFPGTLVRRLGRMPDGRILAATATGLWVLDGAWRQIASTDGAINGIEVTPSGEIFIGGVFSLVNGQPANRIARGFIRDLGDPGSAGATPGGDGVHDLNDWIVFIDQFFRGDPLGDLGMQGGVVGGDRRYDLNDFIVFITNFFRECNAE